MPIDNIAELSAICDASGDNSETFYVANVCQKKLTSLLNSNPNYLRP